MGWIAPKYAQILAKALMCAGFASTAIAAAPVASGASTPSIQSASTPLPVAPAPSSSNGTPAQASTQSNASANSRLNESLVKGGSLGNVLIVQPPSAMAGMVFLFSNRGGWTLADRDAAHAIAGKGLTVVGVDTDQYAANLATKADADHQCHMLADDIDSFSREWQRSQQSSVYFHPILAGVGEGALLAERILGRVLPDTFAGAALLDTSQPNQAPSSVSATALDPRFAPCPIEAGDRNPGFPGFVAAGSRTDRNFSPAIAQDGPPIATQYFAADTSTAEALTALIEPRISVASKPNSQGCSSDIGDLPLIELPAENQTDAVKQNTSLSRQGMLAVIVSGDGGWRDVDKTIGVALQKSGVSVVGFDALRYFWRSKTPDQTTRDLANVIRTYSQRWHIKHVVLIGYSFGADVLPFVYNRLSSDDKANIEQLSLLGLATDADFQVRVVGWLGVPANYKDNLFLSAKRMSAILLTHIEVHLSQWFGWPNIDKPLDARPELAKIPASMLQCFYGEDESDTLCPALAHRGVDVIKTSGGHHFGGDYEPLSEAIFNRWREHLR